MRQEGGKTWQVGARHASVTMMHIDWGELAMPDDKSPFSPNAVHLVRTTQQINLTLSQMADQKASILMGATFVVFTISVGQAGKQGVTAAILVLALFSFISAMLAVFAILPSVATKPIPGGHPNILFFGTFTMMGEDEFADAVLGELKSDETIYRAMLRDIYQNGQVLQRKKYRFLGYAYRAFLAGLVITLATLVFERLS
jgi:hypothetical protein